MTVSSSQPATPEERREVPRGLSLDYLDEKDMGMRPRPGPVWRINIIGAGAMGQEHIGVIQDMKRARVHGLFDTNPLSIESARKWLPEFDAVRKYASIEEACGDPEADALIVSTPNHTHRAVCEVAVKSGRHILVEKPLTSTVEDAAAVVRMAENHPGVFMVGLEYRQKTVYREARHEALERRSIGAIKMISIMEHRAPFLDKVGQWNKFSEKSGGTLVEKCCHYFDLFNLFAQARPARVFASGDMAVNFRDFEYDGKRSDILDHAFAIVEYANGVRACLNLCMFSPRGQIEEMILNGDGGRLLTRDHPENEIHLLVRGDEPSRDGRVHYPPHVVGAGRHGGSTWHEHRQFLDAIDGTPDPQAPTVRDGFWSVVVGAAAERSVRTGSPVLIDEVLRDGGLDPLEW